MKKISLLVLLIVSCILTGCGNGGVDLSRYDKVELTEDNLSDYIEVQRLSGSYDNKTTYLTYQFVSENDTYIFEDVQFDAEIIECYKYNLLYGVESSDNIYIERNKVKLDKRGNSSEINNTQSVSNKITRLCSGDYGMFISDNVSGYVYIPWDE